MGDSVFRHRAFAAALLGGTALSLLMPAAKAQADCVLGPTTPTLITANCTGATTGALPITTLPSAVPFVPQTSGALVLGSDGNIASIQNTNLGLYDLTLTGGAADFVAVDTGNVGAPSSITGATDGLSFLAVNGASILIGQSSAGGNGLNANVTGQNGNGIFAAAAMGGAVNVTTAPGTLVSGSAEGIRIAVEDGPANLIFNGDVATTNAPSFFDIVVTSIGAGAINISGSGSALSGGILAVSSGLGGITIGGSGNTIDSVNGSGIDARITNPANNSAIDIARGGFVLGAPNFDGITAVTAGGGDVTVTTVGNVTGGASGGFGVATGATTGLTTINIGAGSTISGSAGPLSITHGAGAPNAIVNNAGLISFVDGLTATTDLSLPTTATSLNGLGGGLAIDVNPNAGTADVLRVASLSGATSVRVHNLGGLISGPGIEVLSAGTVAPGATVVAANSGLINYSIVQPAPGDYFLTSQVNAGAAGATPTSISAILTALNTGFFQNASAFIAEPPNPERNQINGGPWIRVSGGQNDVRSLTSAQNPSGISSAQAKVRTNFNGFQTGVDLGVANVEGTGWNTHLGVTAGQVLLRTNDLLASNVTSDVQVPFVGIYGAVTGHGFFGDFQVREDFYDMRLTNQAASLSGSRLNGTALAANVSAGYRFDLPSSWFVEPSGAFMYSKLHIDSLRVGVDPVNGSFGSLVFNPFPSYLGRLGLRVGTSYVLDSVQLAVQPFLSGSVWREFADSTLTTFALPGAAVPLTDTRIGTFGQIGLGVSGQVLKTGFLGFVRGDYRFGQNIEGYALVGGLRYQF
jgi:hypothetical protein